MSSTDFDGGSVRTVLGWLNENGERVAMYTLYTYIIFIIGMEVVRRFGLSIPSRWGEETARLLYVYLTWIGASWGIRKRAHIRIDFVYEYLSERAKGGLYVLSDLLFIVFTVFMIRWSVPQLQTLLEFGARTQAGTAPRVFFFFAIPLGGGLMILRALQMTYLDVTALRRGAPVYEGAPIFGSD
jgi:TRAP-type C4-dicarboxylate transport system permease small subunit